MDKWFQRDRLQLDSNSSAKVKCWRCTKGVNHLPKCLFKDHLLKSHHQPTSTLFMQFFKLRPLPHKITTWRKLNFSRNKTIGSPWAHRKTISLQHSAIVQSKPHSISRKLSSEHNSPSMQCDKGNGVIWRKKNEAKMQHFINIEHDAVDIHSVDIHNELYTTEYNSV